MTMSVEAIGHNSQDVRLRIEVRFFNTLTRYSGSDGIYRTLEVDAGTTVGELIARFGIPQNEIFLVMRNGRDITPGLYVAGNVNRHQTLEDGDVIAFSGPVPYSYGYGAPVV
jgi:hypothetical protein